MLAVGGARGRRGDASGRLLVTGAAAALAAGMLLSGMLVGGGAATAAAPAPAATPRSSAIAVVVPITVPATDRGLLSAAVLGEFTATNPAGLLTRQLDAVTGSAATIAVDPMIVESIRVLGDEAPASARAWLARLVALPNESFLLQYADADATLFTQSDAGALLAPTTRATTEDPTADAPGASPTPTPTANDDATDADPVFAPDLDGIVWPRAGTVAATDLDRLDATALVLGAVDVASPASVGGVVDVGGRRALVIEPTASAALLDAARATTDADWDAAIAIAVDAVRAAIAAQPDGTGTVVLGLDRLAAAGAPRLAAAISAIAGAVPVGTTPLASLVDPSTGARTAELVPGAQPPERIAGINRLLGAERAVAGFATAVDDPAVLTTARRLATLAIGSVAWATRDDWGSAVDASIATADELLSSVRIIESSSLFLADRSRLPVAIQNDGPQPVTLLVSADARTGLLDVDSTPVEVVVPAGSQATVEFEATAVSNGSVLVTVTMVSPTGVAIGTPASAEVNVQAGWETPIVVGIGAAFVVLLIFGVIRTVRRYRRRVAEAAAEDAADAPAVPPALPPTEDAPHG